MTTFYRVRSKQWFAGVLAGLADKYNWDLGWMRGIFAALFLCGLSFPFLVLYVILANTWPYKEDIEVERYGQGPRRRKDAEEIWK